MELKHPTEKRAAEVPLKTGATQQEDAHARGRLRIFEVLFAVGCLAAFVVQAAGFIQNNSCTYDETNHLAAGLSAWRTGDFRIYPNNPPLARLLETWPLLLLGAPFSPEGKSWENGVALPLANEIAAAWPGRFHHLVMACRSVTAVFTMLFALLLSHDAWRLFGPFAGIMALLLFSFQPLFIAHGSLATVDAVPALFFYLAVRTFLIFQHRGWTLQRSALMGLALGAALAAKFSHGTLFLILPLCGLASGGSKSLPFSDGKKWTRSLGFTLVALLVVLMVLNAVYGFEGTFHRLSAHHFRSRLMQDIVRFLPPSTPVPFPFQLVRGFDLQSEHNEIMGGKKAWVHWQGKWTPGPAHLFFPLLWAVKHTPPLLILFLLSLTGLADPDYRRRFFSAGDSNAPLPGVFQHFLIVMVVHFVVMAYVVQMYFGARYIIQITPFMILMASAGAEWLGRRLPGFFHPRLALLGLISCSSAFTVWVNYPFYLSYNNIFLGSQKYWLERDPDPVRDWGQGLIALKEWMDKNQVKKIYFGYFGSLDPKVYGIEWEFPPPAPAPGIWAVSKEWLYKDLPHEIQFVSGNKLYIVEPHGPYFSWLLDRKPVAVLARSIFVYQIE